MMNENEPMFGVRKAKSNLIKQDLYKIKGIPSNKCLYLFI